MKYRKATFIAAYFTNVVKKITILAYIPIRFIFYKCNLLENIVLMDFHEDLQILIGKRISEIRMKNNQTQQDLEFLTGIDSAEVSKYEKGKRNLTLKTMIKFAVALQVHPKELFDFDFDINRYKNEE